MKNVLIFLLVFCSFSVFAQEQPLSYSFNFRDLFVIRDFKVTGVASDQKNFKITALDSNGNVFEKIEGPYTFVINGFIEKLNFKKGNANFDASSLNASILYLSHTYKENKVSKLVMLRKTDAGFKTITFPVYVVLLMLVGFIICAALIRKLFVYALVGLFIFYFFYKGVDISTFFEILKAGVTSIIGN